MAKRFEEEEEEEEEDIWPDRESLWPSAQSRPQSTAILLAGWNRSDAETPTGLLLLPAFSAPRWKGDDMKRCLGLFLLLCAGMFHSGSGLRCYKCSDYTGRCQNVQECTYEDSCISLSERDGKTIRQCIRYTDCDNSRLSQMFPAIAGFTYRCCSSNLCNSGNAVIAAMPALALAGSLLSIWWCRH